jgi:hypothetical protein
MARTACVRRSPIVPDFERYPEYGGDIDQTFGEIGLAGHWIKILLHHLFLHKARLRPRLASDSGVIPMDAHTSPPAPQRRPGAADATVPTRRTIFLRTFLPWQAIRFAIINLKMFRLIWRSHHATNRRTQP